MKWNWSRAIIKVNRFDDDTERGLESKVQPELLRNIVLKGRELVMELLRLSNKT
jgi:hypothetical protein